MYRHRTRIKQVYFFIIEIWVQQYHTIWAYIIIHLKNIIKNPSQLHLKCFVSIQKNGLDTASEGKNSGYCETGIHIINA